MLKIFDELCDEESLCEYCTGADSKTKQTFLFSKEDCEKVLYLDRKMALERLNKATEENGGGSNNG